MGRRILAVFAFAVLAALALASILFVRRYNGVAGTTTVTAADISGAPRGAGEPHRRTQGSLSVYVPSELATRNGAFDLVVHFHGGANIQEKNAEQADLGAVVVSVNEGVGTTPYERAVASSDALDRIVRFAESEARASGRVARGHVERVALSSWSAGGAAVRVLLARDEADPRIDAVILADGLFSSYGSSGGDPKRDVQPGPLEPVARFATRALAGDKLFILTHTAIETPGYPSVPECTAALLQRLGIDDSPMPVAGSAARTYVIDRADFHVRGTTGRGPQDHVEELRSLDEAYRTLRKRWRS